MSLFHLWNWGRDISLLACNPLTNCKTCMCIDLAVSPDNSPSGFLSHLCFGKQRALSVGQFVSFITLYVLNFIYIVEKCLAMDKYFPF